MNYELKYLKYKNKYLSLRDKYLNIFTEVDFSLEKSSTLNKKKYLALQDILTYSMNSDFSKEKLEQSNKNKYLSLRDKYLNIFSEVDFSKEQLNKNKYSMNSNKINNQIGGVDRTIIFACTTMIENSTLDKNFDLINNAINRLIPVRDIKHPHFIIVSSNVSLPNANLVSKLVANNYRTTFNSTQNKQIMQFINEEFIGKNNTFDVLVLTGCNDFISTITRPNFLIGRRIDINQIFALVKTNLYNLYKAVNMYIINVYHSKTGFINVEDFMAPMSIDNILSHNICCKIFNRLFTRIEDGIYIKNQGITEEEYNGISTEEFQKNVDLFQGIINDESMTNERKADLIFEHFVPKSYITYISTVFKNDGSSVRDTIGRLINYWK